MQRSLVTQSLLGLILLAAAVFLLRPGHDPALAQEGEPPTGLIEGGTLEPFGPPTGFGPAELEISADVPDVGSGFINVVSDDANAVVSEWLQLQKEYVDLASKRAQLMTVEELQAEIGVAQSALTEVKARRELEEAREILSRLLREHPDSEAAAQAKRMLDAETGDGIISIDEAAAEGESGTTTLDGLQKSFSSPEDES